MLVEKIPLAVAIITKDEEENIGDCLQSVAWASQIVVVDSGSKDKTLSIAAQYNCETHQEDWRGFGAQKQSAIDKCTLPWILLLDADERVPAETAAAIKQIVLNAAVREAGFSFPRKNYFQGRWIKHAGWWPDRVIRLFRNKAGRMTEASVHEAVAVEGAVSKIDFPLEHFTESRLNKIILKIDKYSTLGATEAFKQGKRASLAGALLRAVFTFHQDYFLRLGIMDGMPGLTLAVTDAINKFFKYAKLHELHRNNQDGKP